MTAQADSAALSHPFFEVGRQRIATLVCGDPSARPVLFLHGWLDNAASFARIFKYFSGMYCVAPDFPGHGLSAHHSAEAGYHFVDLVSFIDDFCDQLSASKIDIVGHSMGGAAATLFAAARPERIRSLSLIDTLGPLTDIPANTTSRLREHLRSRRSRVNVARRFVSIDEAVSFRENASFIPTSYEAASDIVRRGLRKSGEGYEWTHDQRLKLPSAYRMSPDQLQQILSDLQGPCLVIKADPGIALPESEWQQRLSLVKNCQIKIFQGNHHIHVDQADAVGPCIRRFMDDH